MTIIGSHLFFEFAMEYVKVSTKICVQYRHKYKQYNWERFQSPNAIQQLCGYLNEN